ncbi:hypothetical protein [Nonomuraea salmonea]|uniref:hypothetical protein n=1 Tax=Nonomuraea salmonea TaxID=46181 RepID=UPI0031E4E839
MDLGVRRAQVLAGGGLRVARAAEPDREGGRGGVQVGDLGGVDAAGQRRGQPEAHLIGPYRYARALRHPQPAHGDRPQPTARVEGQRLAQRPVQRVDPGDRPRAGHAEELGVPGVLVEEDGRGDLGRHVRVQHHRPRGHLGQRPLGRPQVVAHGPAERPVGVRGDGPDRAGGDDGGQRHPAEPPPGQGP